MIEAGGVLLAAACAVLMGVAIQRGSTCIVAGVQEWVERSDRRRLFALSEGAVWSGTLLALAGKAGAMPTDAPVHAVGVWTFFGGALLGLGAWVNGACVFGSVAAIGAGDGSYLAFPVGLATGTAMVNSATAVLGENALAPLLPVAVDPWVSFSVLTPFWLVSAAVLGGAFVWRRAQRVRARSGEASGEWTPRAGIVLVCVASAAMTFAFGPWVYSEVIAAWVRGDTSLTDTRFLLFPALLAGALLGGWTRGRLQPRRPTFPVVWRCLLGGALMAIGARMVPGANDGLLLMGLPKLAPEALVGLGSMILTLVILMVGARRLRRVSTEGARQKG